MDGPGPSSQRNSFRRFFKRNYWRQWLGICLALAAGGFFLIPWLYINVFSEPAPPPLSFEQLDKVRAGEGAPDAAATTVNDSGKGLDGKGLDGKDSFDGNWTIVAPSSAGYRVQESIAGQPKTAVGRTSTVDGSFSVANFKVTSAEINVDLASIVSGNDRRDAQFRGRIIAADEFPVATFTLGEGFLISADPAATSVEAVQVSGTVALRGTERPATFTISARKEGPNISIIAKTEIVFADYGIPNPSIGPVATEDHGTIEVALTATRNR